MPLTLLELTAEHRYAVIEMGANHIGEIAHLASLAEPTVGIVTNAGAAHLEGFGSLAGVAQRQRRDVPRAAARKASRSSMPTISSRRSGAIRARPIAC